MKRETAKLPVPAPAIDPTALILLQDDLILLAGLYTRSKYQHGSQLFFQRLQGVSRLSRRLLDRAMSSVGGTDNASGTETWELPILANKLIASLYKAHLTTAQQIHLHHFLPLQTILLAVYARLHAIAQHILGRCQSAPSIVSTLAARESTSADIPRAELDSTVLSDIMGDVDIGSSMSRSMFLRPTCQHKAFIDEMRTKSTSLLPANGLDFPNLRVQEDVGAKASDETARDIQENMPPNPVDKQKLKKRKRRRGDAMDEIFG